jgi:hypothetical protein
MREVRNERQLKEEKTNSFFFSLAPHGNEKPLFMSINFGVVMAIVLGKQGPQVLYCKICIFCFDLIVLM